MTTAQNDRMVWLDGLRLIAGVSIVGLHASSDINGQPFPDYSMWERTGPVLFRSVVYTARTELFLIISLFLLFMSIDARPRKYSEVIVEQSKRLMRPFLFWVIFYAFYRLIKASYFGYADAIWAQLSNSVDWLGYLVLDEVFVSQDQVVQKGELLGAVKADAIRLDISETQRDLALKILERHCFIMLKENRLRHSLPQASALIVDQLIGHENTTKKLNQCQKQQLRNQTETQSLEEIIAALEDQSRLLETVVKVRNAIEATPNRLLSNVPQSDADFIFPFGGDQTALQKAYRDQYFPMMRLAQVQQELRDKRAEYFSWKVQIEEDLIAAIKLAEQEIRYLDDRLRQLDEQLENTFIFASITGKVVALERAQVGTRFKKHETAFELQPLKSDFQVSISLEDKDSHRFEVGTIASVSLGNGKNIYEPIKAKTTAMLRKPDGKLEAILNLDGNASENARIILASGYIGQGQQRLRGNITSGEDKIWQAVASVFPIK